MAKCENCIHHGICDENRERNHRISNSVCKHFKDKDLIAELPCKVGEILYVIDYDCDSERSYIEKVKCHSIEICDEDDISIYCETIESQYDTYIPDDFGEVIFRTREEAEAVFKEVQT